MLIVSPHFAPINAPDMQRVRLSLPYLEEMGWEPVVLALQPGMVEGGVVEPLLEKTYPSTIRVLRVRGLPPCATRWAGIGDLWLRCGTAIRTAGERLLRDEKFDLVFFSTTQFDAFRLGPIWRTKFGVPYVLDYQDPWVNFYYRDTGTPPPGGRIKFAISLWLSRLREPKVLRNASGVIAVSKAYGISMSKRYPWFDADSVTILPFGAAVADTEAAKLHKPIKPIVSLGDGYFHHVYTGRCGPDMSASLTILFRAFKIFLAVDPVKAQRVRFHFIGTDYAPRPFGKEWAMPLARAEAVEAYVTEERYRVPYFDALWYLINADALIVMGSNDPTYSASKIYPYFLARRPMLVVLNRASAMAPIVNELKCGRLYEFYKGCDLDKVANRVAQEWFIAGASTIVPAVDANDFVQYSAEGMTRTLARCFDAAIQNQR